MPKIRVIMVKWWGDVSMWLSKKFLKASPPPTTHFQKTENLFLHGANPSDCFPQQPPRLAGRDVPFRKGNTFSGKEQEPPQSPSPFQVTQSQLRELKASQTRQFWKRFSFLMVRDAQKKISLFLTGFHHGTVATLFNQERRHCSHTKDGCRKKYKHLGS